MSGTLFMIATPIGNLKDMTYRGIEVIKSLDVLLAEDTRVTRKLLDNYEIVVNLVSYQQHSSDTKKYEILKMLTEGKTVGLVTDAGTPGVSDPGNELVDFILEHDSSIKVIPVPGVSSITSALSVCGFKAGNFSFLGYYPKKGKTKILDRIMLGEETIVFFESPYRIRKMIDDLIGIGFERRIFLAQEITKLHERYFRGSVEEVAEKIKVEEKNLGRIKGEIVVVIEGK